MTKRATFDKLSRAGGTLLTISLYPLATFAVAWLSWTTAQDLLPADPRALKWLQLTQDFTRAIVPLFYLGMFVAMWASRANPIYALWRAICGGLHVGMLLGLAAMFMSIFGDRTFLFIDESPVDAVMYVALALIVGYAWKSAWVTARGSAVPHLLTEAANPRLDLFVSPSSNDVRRIAAHEAGHVLLYAALGETLPDVRVTLRDRPDSHGSMGSVTGVGSTDRLPRIGFVEWQMLVLLAGAESERLLEGSYSLGATEDNQRWLDLAKAYLTARPGPPVYYLNSIIPSEVEGNAAAIAALHSEQVSLVRAFLNTNLSVLKDIADHLAERRKLEREDLIPHLMRVVLPADMPLPVSKEHLFPPANRSDCGNHRE
ncbi:MULTISPECIES: hypothetical protein [Achromobacter]|uniref:hypothetical protein n=1 Tax=Achromobacter TaxID=222 RepID=UPI0023FA318D|nr:hypothetical protein [Achromobacter anxifer]MDF8362044.1 hypothetical protein [Achromobacter anxifer]